MITPGYMKGLEKQARRGLENPERKRRLREDHPVSIEPELGEEGITRRFRQKSGKKKIKERIQTQPKGRLVYVVVTVVPIVRAYVLYLSNTS